MPMMKEFKEFLLKQNVVALAIAVVVGTDVSAARGTTPEEPLATTAAITPASATAATLAATRTFLTRPEATLAPQWRTSRTS